MLDVESLMFDMPSLDFERLETRTLSYFRKMDVALDAAFHLENAGTDWAQHSSVIWQWINCSKEFFESTPQEINDKTMPFYMRVHNALLHLALASGKAEKFSWEPTP